MKSFIKRRRKRPRAKISVCSYTRGRQELRKTIRTWVRQVGFSRDDLEFVVAEFGEAPEIADEIEEVDTYLFCRQPKDSPFAACWWRNVPAYNATASKLIIIDGDIAAAPEAFRFLDGLTPQASDAVNVRKLSWRAEAWENPLDLKFPDREREAAEAVWCIGTAEFKRIGGWPESYFGYHGEYHAFDGRLAQVCKIKRVAAYDFFCHIPHEPVRVLPRDNYFYYSSFPHKSIARFNPKKWDGQWPRKDWEPGRYDLLEVRPEAFALKRC